MIIVINDSVQIGWNPRELPFCFHFIFVWVCLCVWKSFWFRLRTSKLRYWTVASSTIAAGCIAFGWEIDLNWQTRSGTARKSVGQNVMEKILRRTIDRNISFVAAAVCDIITCMTDFGWYSSFIRCRLPYCIVLWIIRAFTCLFISHVIYVYGTATIQ